MAATQAEKQQNDVNCEKVQPDQHLNVRNSLLQNGTDKSVTVRGGGGVAGAKAKITGGKNPLTEMSQYRQEGNGGGPATMPGVPASGTGPVGVLPLHKAPDSGPGDSESGPGSASAGPDMNAYPVEGPPSADGHGYGGFYGRDVHNSAADGGVHAFGPRQVFGGPKQPPTAPFSQHQQRFVSGQALSQPTGPTPTLNQLLQSSNPIPHRYQNSYTHPEQPYNQGWPAQKSLGTYGAPPVTGPGVPPQSYRNQQTVSSVQCIKQLPPFPLP